MISVTASRYVYTDKLSVKFNRESVPFVSIMYIFLTELTQKDRISIKFDRSLVFFCVNQFTDNSFLASVTRYKGAVKKCTHLADNLVENGSIPDFYEQKCVCNTIIHLHNNIHFYSYRMTTSLENLGGRCTSFRNHM